MPLGGRKANRDIVSPPLLPTFPNEVAGTADGVFGTDLCMGNNNASQGEVDTHAGSAGGGACRRSKTFSFCRSREHCSSYL